MLFPQVYSFFLAGSFQFSFRSTLSSALFVYRLPCYPKLSIFNRVSNLIDLIFMYSACSFRYTLVNSLCAFLSFSALVLARFLRLYAFFLTANISHGTLGLALCLVSMHSAAPSKCAWTKFSYSSFGVVVSDISWSTSNFLVLTYIYL